ncbi:cleavage and polyadenylation specificity factor subunit CG7185 [Ipomoea triloba]|uniref:cleavage and polyadenylation specificity factor subunit CG7185 n=1 Tax=Ipomoea triloba TaxID=35885 RepID=UPI00125DE7BD|nr:cleavage and polyadenylation specificity factor subunit CG7185 [Ipomoea triloba]XP_031104899.1 cleavage and polyadenylation specificity factor subunit CG7185 [Ipomoea triloba]
MDANEGGDGFGDGVGDPSEQFHRNEAISAVADEGFLGEEDDDYEDLYNDVNVGENFLQSLKKNEDLGFRNEEVAEKLPPKPTTVTPPAQTPSAIGGERKAEKEEDGGTRSSGRLEGYQSMGFRVNEMGARSSSVAAGGSGTPGGELRVELGHSSGKVADLEEQAVSGNAQNQCVAQQPHVAPVGNLVNVGITGNDSMARQGGGNMSANISGGGAFGVGGGGGGGPGGGTVLFVGDLHWWTTDAELEAELCKYGPVKEVKFFDEKASGKSKGYCQVEYFDPSAATACKEGMNGHVFNGRPCVVAFASPYTVKKMGEAQLNRNQQMTQTSAPQARRGPGDAIGKPSGNNIATGGNYQGGGDNNRGGYGRGNWGGRGGAQGMGNRGPLGPMRNRPGGVGGRGLMGNGGSAFGQGIGGTPPMLHPQAMMGPGFDPAFGGPMGRMGSYGGFPGAPTPPFSGILPSFPPVGSVGLPGVAPHVNPAFFGRGMPMNGMGMMPGAGVEGPNMGMWSDMNMGGGGWTGGEEHGGRAGESSYNEEAVSDHQHGEVSHDRGAWPGGLKEKDRGVERDWSGSTDRRHRDDKEPGFDREMPREKDTGHDHDWSERKHRDSRDIGRERERERERSRDRDRDRDRDVDRDRDRDRGHDRERDHHRDERYAAHHRHRDHEPEYNDDWDRGRSSRTHAKSRVSREEEQRSRSRDTEYGKRRRSE